ncbi:hypothetical protein E2C01_009604 [Portunus trituberculatus]|uniref:Uncharacterized protein n=1 Tax=Portunus trituberculatus TaxID=210409 RepID=A0A5B7D679_PORTR|nr:hypothetical protein [Portunus trituberculatus]
MGLEVLSGRRLVLTCPSAAAIAVFPVITYRSQTPGKGRTYKLSPGSEDTPDPCHCLVPTRAVPRQLIR